MPEIASTSSLFSSFSAFDQLTSALASSSSIDKTERALLLSTTIRALEALALALSPSLVPQNDRITTHAQAEAFPTLTLLLHHLLTTALPLLKRKVKGRRKTDLIPAAEDAILDVLTSQIIRPAIRAFRPMCHAYTTAFFPAIRLAGKKESITTPTKPAPAAPADLRPEVLSLFRAAFLPFSPSSAGTHPPSDTEALNTRALTETLALLALRELTAVLTPPRPAQLHTREARLRALAAKDALWYLCAVLGVLFSPGGARGGGASTCAGEMLDAFSEILGRCRRNGERAGTGWEATGAEEAREAREAREREQAQERGCYSPQGQGRGGGGGGGGGASEAPPFRRRREAEHDETPIDEVGHEMLLGAVEAYWLWSLR